MSTEPLTSPATATAIASSTDKPLPSVGAEQLNGTGTSRMKSPPGVTHRPLTNMQTAQSSIASPGSSQGPSTDTDSKQKQPFLNVPQSASQTTNTEEQTPTGT